MKSQEYILELLKKLDLKINSQPKTGKDIIETAAQQSTTKANPFDACNPLERLQLFKLFVELETLTEEVTFSDPSKLEHLDETPLQTFIERHLSTKRAKNIFQTSIFATLGVNSKDVSTLFYLAFCRSTLGLSNHLLNEDDPLFVQVSAHSNCQDAILEFSRAEPRRSVKKYAGNSTDAT